MRRIKSVIAPILAATLFLAGCGIGKPDTTVTSEPADNTAPEAVATETPAEPETVPEETGDKATGLLAKSVLEDIIYVVDSDGDVIKRIDRREINDNLSEEERERYRIYRPEQYNRSDLLDEGDGFLFFSDYALYGDEYEHAIYAISENDYKLYPIATPAKDAYIKGIDYYNGSLYVDLFMGYDNEGNGLGEHEMCFTYDETTDSFEETEAPGDTIVSAKAMGYVHYFI